ncbi:MAG: cytochrome c maturation protein CcmE [Alphaproteobacteria bacterium]|nr:cytochrome c maturation protein CcmE [Alphaproteobacteria bacterium]
MSPKQKRLWYLILIALFLGGCSLIILTTLNNHLLFFMMPTDVLASKPTNKIRLGGFVKSGSLQHPDPTTILFKITDGLHEIPVRYIGVVPNLFREGQGVVAEGILSSKGEFQASYLLAKHDENYMPREVAASLKTKEKCQRQESAMEKSS